MHSVTMKFKDGKMFHSRDVRYTWGMSHVFLCMQALLSCPG